MNKYNSTIHSFFAWFQFTGTTNIVNENVNEENEYIDLDPDGDTIFKTNSENDTTIPESDKVIELIIR